MRLSAFAMKDMIFFGLLYLDKTKDHPIGWSFMVEPRGIDLHFLPPGENRGAPPSSRRRQQSTGLLHMIGSIHKFSTIIIKATHKG